MTYYPTIEEDLARAKEILAKGQRDVSLVQSMGGEAIYASDIYAAYKLLESFVAEIEDARRSFALYHNASMALMHAYKTAHPDVPDLVWPAAAKVNEWANERIAELEDALHTNWALKNQYQSEVAQLRLDQTMLATTLRHIVVAVTHNDDWEGTVEHAHDLLNQHLAAINAVIERLELENHTLRTEKRQQLQLLTTIRTLADDATGTDRSQNDPREPGALGAVKLLIARFRAHQQP